MKVRNIKDIYKDHKDDINILLMLMSKYFGYEFAKKGKDYKCTSNQSIRISYNKSHGWTVNDFGSQNLFGNLRGMIITLVGRNNIKREYEIMRELGADTTDYLTKANARSLHNPQKRNAVKNEGAAQPTYTNYNSKAGLKVLSYLSNKTGSSTKQLELHNIKPILKFGEYAYNYNNENLAFSYATKDQGFKVKRVIDGIKKPLTYSTKNYCFGFDQLPSKGKFLFITEGEDDALCINANCAKFGFYAISFGGVTNKPPKAIIEHLRARFERIFILFDNDYQKEVNTGTQAAKKYSKELNLELCEFQKAIPLINPLDKSQYKDICDFYQLTKSSSTQIHASNQLLKLIRYSTTLYHFPKIKDDPFSIEVPNALRLNFNQYLGESKPNDAGIIPMDYIADCIHSYNRLSIAAPAGAGKTTLLKLLCMYGGEFLQLFKDFLECSTVIIAAPVTPICEQLYRAFMKGGKFTKDQVCLVMGSKQRGLTGENKVIICTYDKLENDNIKRLIPSSFLCLDEFHQLANDRGYRTEAMPQAWEASKRAKKVLLLSATPNLMFTTNLDTHFNYKFLRCYPKTSNTKNLTIITHDCPKVELYEYIEMISPEKGTVIVKNDSNRSLKKFREKLLDRQISCEHFTSSGGRERKEGNANYQRIIKEGLFAQFIRFLLTTTLFEAGVSIESLISAIHLLDTVNVSRIIQSSARPRMQADGTNSVVDIYVYLQPNKQPPQINFTSIKQRYNEEKINAQALCNKLNKLHNPKQSKDYPVDTDPRSNTIKEVLFDDTLDNISTEELLNNSSQVLPKLGQKIYVIDVVGILYNLYNLENSLETPESIKRKIEHLDSSFNISIQHGVSVRSNDLREALKEEKAEEEEKEDCFKNLLSKQPKITLQALAYLNKNSLFKHEIRHRFLLKAGDHEQILQHIEDNKKAFSFGNKYKLIRTAIELLDLRYTKEKAINTVTSHDLKEIKEEVNAQNAKKRLSKIRKVATTGKNSDLSPMAQMEAKKYEKIVKKLSRLTTNIQQGNSKNEFTADQITKIINDTLKLRGSKKLEFRQAKKYVCLFYDVGRKTKGNKEKKVNFYYFKSLKRKAKKEFKN